VEEIFSPIVRQLPRKGQKSKMKGLFGTATELFATPEKGGIDAAEEEEVAAYDAAAGAAVEDSEDSVFLPPKALRK